MISLKTLIVTIATVISSILAPAADITSSSPESSQKTKRDVISEIRPKLEDEGFSFKLESNHTLIPKAYAEADYNQAFAYGVVDFQTGEILAEKNLTKKLPIASLTKVMTAVVALDLADKDDLFTISKNASLQSPTKLVMIPGQKMKLEELLKAILLTSANDAAEVIKEGVNEKYGADIFVQAMNEKTKFLNLSTTSFSNPQGFDHPKHYSSVEDLSILTKYAIDKYPLIAQIVADDYEFLPEDQNHKQHDLHNWNGLIGVYPGAKGVKIGNTGKARVTTIVLAEREGKQILVVLLGALTVLERDLWAAQLLDLGFAKSLDLVPVNVTKQDLIQKYSTWEFFR